MQLMLANSAAGWFVGHLDLIESLLVIEEKLVDMPRGILNCEPTRAFFDPGVRTDSCAPRSRGSPPGAAFQALPQQHWKAPNSRPCGGARDQSSAAPPAPRTEPREVSARHARRSHFSLCGESRMLNLWHSFVAKMQPCASACIAACTVSPRACKERWFCSKVSRRF